MSWLGQVLNRESDGHRLDAELQFDYDQRVADNIRGGMSETEARRAARLEFGGIDQVKEECRDVRSMRSLQDLIRDVRYSVRVLRLNPGFATVAVLTLALGTGVTTLMFSTVSSVILRPLPYPQPDRLVSVNETKSGEVGSFSYPDITDVARATRSLDLVTPWRYGGGTLSEPGEAANVSGREVSEPLFPLLGIAPIHGRAFLPEEDRPGGKPVAIISYQFWQERFGGRTEALGARLVLNGRPYTVVGILSRALNLESVLSLPVLHMSIDVLTPLGQDTRPEMLNREIHPGISAFARLRSGVTPGQAGGELAEISRRLAEQYPTSDAAHVVTVSPLKQKIVGDSSQRLWILLGAVSLVLLIACVNVASLLLARAISREREVAMRVALGASRGRLIRQYSTESVLLSLCGGLLGSVLSAFGTRPFLRLWPGGLPRAEEVQFDWRVFAFALGASVLSGVLFGLAPALRAPICGLEQAIRRGARGIAGTPRRLHRAFVVSEIALAIVLLVAAGLLARTMLRLMAVDPGFNARNVLMTTVSLSPRRVIAPSQAREAWADLLEQIDRIPGVQSAAGGFVTPMSENNDDVGYWTSPARPPNAQMPSTLLALVTPDYLKTMGITLRRGRFLERGDRSGGELVTVVDESLAKHAFGDRDPVGQYLWIEFIGRARITGVAAHVRYYGLYEDEKASIRDQLYISFDQAPDTFMANASDMYVYIRTAGPPLSITETLRRQIRGFAHDGVLSNTHTMDDLVSGSLGPQRFLLLLFGVFAGLALLLASVGVYGVLAYLTNQRVPEIGVRMALGAKAGDVIRLIFRQSLGMVLAGVGIGALASVGAAHLLESLNAGVRGADPFSFAIMIVVLLAAALLAIWIPARRASNLNPVSALREE